MNRFRVIEFQLQQACNAHCLYCAYEQELPEYHDWLPLEIVDRTLARERPEWVWFEGGEVTMTEESKEYLLEAMAIANRYGVKNRINTNGHNLSPEWVRKLAAGGLQFACVSFDSLDPELFERLRGFPAGSGPSRLEQLKTNVISLADAGVTVDLEATATKYNIHELEGLYEYVESLATPGRDLLMGVQFLVATYDATFKLYPSLEQLATTLGRLTARARQGRTPVRICCSQLVPCNYPDLYQPHPNVIWVRCSCGYDYVHVHANGDVFLCGFWDHTQPIGNLREASLREIWEGSELRHAAMTESPSQCGGCAHWEGTERCHNTCFSIAYRKTGTFTTMAYDLTAATLEALAEGAGR